MERRQATDSEDARARVCSARPSSAELLVAAAATEEVRTATIRTFLTPTLPSVSAPPEFVRMDGSRISVAQTPCSRLHRGVRTRMRILSSCHLSAHIEPTGQSAAAEGCSTGGVVRACNEPADQLPSPQMGRCGPHEPTASAWRKGNPRH